MAREIRVARRYAQALFNAARTGTSLDRIAADVQGLLDLDARDPALRLFLESPQVRDDHKHAVIDVVIAPRVDSLVTRFLHLLLQKKRVAELADIAREFATLVEEARGILRAPVWTAVPLSQDETAALTRELEGLTGKTVRLEVRIEPEVLGGVVVKLGDRIIDRSVRTLLDQLRDDLLAVSV